MQSKLERNEKLIIFALFAISCILKIFLVLPAEAPVVFGDEYLYKENAKYILKLDYYSSHYPPLYSLIQSLSFVVDASNFYLVMQVINVILSSLLVYPTWLLAKKYLGYKDRIVVSILILLIPFQVVYPRIIMSENLYYSLFIFLVYFTIISSEKLRYIDSVILGITIAFCLMTRYMTYALLPTIVFIWVVLSYISMKLRNLKLIQMIKEWLCKGSTIVISTFIISMPWIFTRYIKGYPILEIFNKNRTEYISTSGSEHLIKWTVFYGCLFVLSLSPLLLPLFFGLLNSKIIKLDNDEKKFTFATIFITIPIYLTAIKHSSQAYYNQDIPYYIIGRYTTYVLPLWLILSYILIKKIYNSDEKRTNNIKLIISTVISEILIYISYLTIIKGRFYKISDSFVLVVNATDVYSYSGGGIIFLFFAIMLIILCLIFLIKKQFSLFTSMLFLFYIISSLICFNCMERFQDNKVFNNLTVNHIKDIDNKIYVSKDLGSQQEYYIKFWELEDKIIEYDNESRSLMPNYGDIILSKNELPFELLFKHKSSYLYKYEKHEMKIVRTYPDKISIGTKFNVQSNGKSAMAIKGSGFIPGCYVTINGDKIDATFGSSELITIIVDDHYYEKRNDLIIKVIYDDLIESNEIIIPVR